ncbi:MAG: hypothetical protein JNM17_14125 [Archangium sp.]|nr:hypothetical protein [Archangium sp.]
MRALFLLLCAVMVSACFFQPLAIGPCEFGNPERGCRPGRTCTPANVCELPCSEGATVECDADGGTRTSTCAAGAWGPCEPSVFVCTPGQRRDCAVTQNGQALFGEQSCVDGGFGVCAVTAATDCRKRLGACSGAQRLFSDPTPGCSDVSYFALDAGYASVETCPADGIDNDCDGYTDETLVADAEPCGVGMVCGARGDGGLLLAYRRCGDTGCSTNELMTTLGTRGFAPLDLCAGVDNDCSGVVNAGRARVLFDSADEVSLLGDEWRGGNDRRLYRAVVAERVSDGGFNVAYFRINEDLSIESASRMPVASRTAPFAARIQPQSDSTSIIVWRDSATAVGRANAVLNNATGVRLPFNPPATIVTAPEVAPLGSDALLAVGIRLSDGGTASLVKKMVSADSTIDWACGGDAGLCLPVRVWLSGDGRARATVTSSVATNSSGIVSVDPNDLWTLADGGRWDGGLLEADGGPQSFYAQFDGLNVRLVLNTALFDTSAVTIANAGGVRVAGQFVASNLRLPFVYAFRDDDVVAREVYLMGTEQFVRNVVEEQSAMVAAVVDGGVSVLWSGRLADGGDELMIAPTTVDGGYQQISTVVGGPALGWTSKFPNYALLAAPERTPDGGTAVVGRLVCMPQKPIR